MQLEEGIDKNCTFQPFTSQDSQRLVRPVSPQDQAYLFNRLYKDGEKRLHYKAQLEEIKVLQETENCTFQPQTLTNTNTITTTKGGVFQQQLVANNEKSDDAHSRLYEDAIRAENMKIRAQIERENDLKKSHPFTPVR